MCRVDSCACTGHGQVWSGEFLWNDCCIYFSTHNWTVSITQRLLPLCFSIKHHSVSYKFFISWPSDSKLQKGCSFSELGRANHLPPPHPAVPVPFLTTSLLMQNKTKLIFFIIIILLESCACWLGGFWLCFWSPPSPEGNIWLYRPISNLPFVSQILEKAVTNQLCDYNSLFEDFQSGFQYIRDRNT